MRRHFFGVTAGLALALGGAAQAQHPPYSCGDVPNPSEVPRIAPIFQSNTGLSDGEFDCLAWQDFIYLNWPALAGQRGVPNKSARFGAPGPTVWETFKTVDEVFLPNGQNPGPWNQPQLMTTLNRSLAQRVARGQVRHLTMMSKISRRVLANILSSRAESQQVLDEIAQAGGGILYDLNGQPVYYEVAMDEAQYDYIVQNGLYDAGKQFGFALKNVIDLPAGTATKSAALELKAAWKVLSSAEQKSGRFHTTQAVLDGSKTPVTVGLVGFHMFIANGAQGAWATFAQADNAPVAKPASSGTFNFFNPNCKVPGTTTPCPFNVKDADPGQVVQITPDDPTAVRLNTYMRGIITAYDAKTPWQYYKLVNVQWATLPKSLSRLKAPANVPLPDGNPNNPTLVNAVLETFVQKPGIGCFSCHQYASVARSGRLKANFATSYSFIFGHASSPK